MKCELHLKKTIYEWVEQYVPLKEEFRKSHCVIAVTIRVMKQSSKYWRKYRRSQSAANYEKYQSLHNKVNSLVREGGTQTKIEEVEVET